jgi:hypothetical protein
MKTLAILFAFLFIIAPAWSQTTFVSPPSTIEQRSGSTYTYYNTITPNGQSHTGFVFTQPTSPSYPQSGIVTDLNSGNQYYYNQSGGYTNIIDLNSKD